MDKETCDPSLASYLREREDLLAVARAAVGNVHVAEELVQDCWIRWTRRSYPAVDARPVLMRIVKNLAIDWHRRRRVEFAALEEQRLLQELQPDSERIIIARDRLHRVIKALENLPPRTLLAFRYCRVDCLTMKETGMRLGVSESRVSQMVSDAVVHIALALDAKKD